MPQLPLPLVRATLRPLYRLTLNARLPYPLQRRLLELAAPIQTLPRGTVVQRTELAGRPAERVTVGATERPTALLYLHGGAYTCASPATHRSLVAYLAAATQSVVYTLDYRLAPEHPYPAALDDAVGAYLELITEHGVDAARTPIAGDSAGGGLTVATARRLIDRHGVTPAALGLLSPWTDPGSRTVPFDRDVVINTAWVFASAKAYLGDGDPTDPGYAPLHGDLSGLPPTLIQVGTTEVLYPQILEFARRLRDAGVDLTLVEQPELWHVAGLQASLVREAREAVVDFGAFLRSHAADVLP
ncbi:alpha/beta hydrolase [Rhodococcus chondri]|uniref:Alpha/beta hydrolase n=1 Tax=Rhodococcus chondri TaxID=3065941 RepID=A0ABU7JVY2_9NOCA|nr:alpha/beta hydrolase [Rhodococcus sp. CC-R104]MEE2034176.1 alpha/beta hydrolase [Rhodococcus sp. CC-R104]